MPYLGQLVGSDHGLFIRAQLPDKDRRKRSAYHEHQRLVLKSIIADMSVPQEVRAAAVRKLAEQPGNNSFTKVVDHCIYTRRAKGIVTAFKMSRITFRRMAVVGLIPGIWTAFKPYRSHKQFTWK